MGRVLAAFFCGRVLAAFLLATLQIRSAPRGRSQSLRERGAMPAH